MDLTVAFDFFSSQLIYSQDLHADTCSSLIHSGIQLINITHGSNCYSNYCMAV